jgi:predicted helicase
MEGENIFESGSMTGIAITFLVKNPQKKKTTDVFYHDIGNALSRDEKLDALKRLGSLYQMKKNSMLSPLVPDEHGDWLRQRDDSFSEYFIIGDKRNREPSIFENYSFGAETKRDAWCCNASRNELILNISRMIEFYNAEVFRFNSLNRELIKADRADKALGSISSDKTKIKWSENLIRDLVANKTRAFEKSSLRTSLYRPFSKEWLYYNKELNWSRYRLPKIFPTSNDNNIVICVSGVGARSGFTALMADHIPAFDLIEKGQCFPLYLYEAEESQAEIPEKKGGELFTSGANDGPKRRDAITDDGLAHFRSAYPSENIGKEDLFYYVYGLLHSPDYRERYADNLSKELPRIPRVKASADFWAFSRAGRALADLHLNYESVEPYPVKMVCGNHALSDADYRVEKMRYGKSGKDKDLTTLIYNDKITLTGIPPEAYGYVVNGKPALDWVVERQCVKTDKDSGIIDDANDWAIETMNNPRYPLELFQRVITVSLKTLGIVRKLPPLGELS